MPLFLIINEGTKYLSILILLHQSEILSITAYMPWRIAPQVSHSRASDHAALAGLVDGSTVASIPVTENWYLL